jgi:hypothetical protein
MTDSDDDDTAYHASSTGLADSGSTQTNSPSGIASSARTIAGAIQSSGDSDTPQTDDPLQASPQTQQAKDIDASNASDAGQFENKQQQEVTAPNLDGARRYSVPDPSNLPDAYASPQQISDAVDRMQSAPQTTDGNEQSTSRVNGKWTDWTMGKPDSSLVWTNADISDHLHPPDKLSENNTMARFMPGPGDHLIPALYGHPDFYLTPDRNSVVEVGIKDHNYFADVVWQREGTTNPVSGQYRNWQPTGRDSEP